jgi:hypothetical protein
MENIIDLAKEKCFIIKCSDWNIVLSAESETEACTKALINMLAERGKDLKLSSVMVSSKITKDFIPNEVDDDFNEVTSYHSVSRMLANAGFHDLSVKVRNIFGA